MTQNIVAQFPIVSKADLVYGDSCAICHETYAAEQAVRLPCGHEFGFECISTWLSPEGGRTTCPLCRHQLVAGTTSALDDPEVQAEALAIFQNIITAVERDIRVTELGLSRHRARSFREWVLYMDLRDRGADLPPWRPPPGEIRILLTPPQEEALFRELQRRGAFVVLPFEVGPLVTVRVIWDYLRETGYCWDPTRALDSPDNCGWSRS